MTTDSPKPSRAAKLSLIFGLLIWSMWCVFSLGFGALANSNNLDEATGYALIIGGPIVLGLLSIIFSIAGTIFGVQALRKKDPRRNIAIAGFALNFICLLPVLLFVVASLISGASAIPDFIQQFLPLGQ